MASPPLPDAGESLAFSHDSSLLAVGAPGTYDEQPDMVPQGYSGAVSLWAYFPDDEGYDWSEVWLYTHVDPGGPLDGASIGSSLAFGVDANGVRYDVVTWRRIFLFNPTGGDADFVGPVVVQVTPCCGSVPLEQERCLGSW